MTTAEAIDVLFKLGGLGTLGLLGRWFVVRPQISAETREAAANAREAAAQLTIAELRHELVSLKSYLKERAITRREELRTVDPSIPPPPATYREKQDTIPAFILTAANEGHERRLIAEARAKAPAPTLPRVVEVDARNVGARPTLPAPPRRSPREPR
jgi:hypothetical protein